MINFSDAIKNKNYCKDMLLQYLEDEKIDKQEANSIYSIFEDTIDYLSEKSESPIETIFENTLLVLINMTGHILFPISFLNIFVSDKEKLQKEERNTKKILLEIYKTKPLLFISAQTTIRSKERIDLCLFYLGPNSYDLHSLAIELDGYEYHKGKFISDRKKDRNIRKNGYEDVYRFSGTEIVKDPIEACTDVIEWFKYFRK